MSYQLKVNELKRKRTSKCVKAKKRTLEAKILLEIPENANPLLIFEGTTNFNELVKHICDQTSLNGTQNGKEYATNPEEIRAFLGINYIMPISKLPDVKCYWSIDSYLSNDGVRNTMKRNPFINLLQNLHFTDNQTADKSEKAYNMRIIINHLTMFHAERQSIYKHLTKYKGRLSCRQYTKKQANKMEF